MPATPLAALPPGTAPPPTLVIAPVPPAAGATQPAVPPVPPAAQGVPFAPTPYAAVFARSLPGSALRAVTPDELARRGTFVPTPLVSGMQPGLAADEVLLTCTLPEALPRLAAAPSTGSKPARAAPSRKEGTW